MISLSQTQIWNWLLGLVLLTCQTEAYPQEINSSDSVKFTLLQCVSFTLNNQPEIRQAAISEEITNRNILISLSRYFPQADVNANLQHYLTLPTIFLPNSADPAGPKIAVQNGLINSSSVDFSATQSIYSTDLIFAGKSIRDQRILSKQNTENIKINSVVNVSKAFWDVLLSEEQLGVLNEDIQRLEQNYTDARHLFENGLTDKIDYQQASISLNNAKVQQKTTLELIRTKYAALKQVMGFPRERNLQVLYDSTSLVNETGLDTTLVPAYTNRVEYRQLETNLRLQDIQTRYYRWSFLPELSAFYDYNLIFQNNKFSELYNTNYPNSLIGLKLTLPISQGTNRWQNIRKSVLQSEQIKLDEEILRNQINADYVRTLGSYKSNLNAFVVARTNITIAREVFSIVKLQYNQGIKTYLDVVIADSDLRTAQLNYLSALFQVLSSKLDLLKTLGSIAP